MISIVEMNSAQLKFLKEFFNSYEDEKVKVTIKDDSNRVRALFTVESDLEGAALESYLKSTFKDKSKYGAALYYTIHVK